MQPNAFTIGNKSSYDRALAAGPVFKQPRSEGYEGGCCWRTQAEAEAYLAPTCGMLDFGNGHVFCTVYGLILPDGWEVDVDSSNAEKNGYSSLLTESLIVKPDGDVGFDPLRELDKE